jgi:hypothetical protein
VILKLRLPACHIFQLPDDCHQTTKALKENLNSALPVELHFFSARPLTPYPGI